MKKAQRKSLASLVSAQVPATNATTGADAAARNVTAEDAPASKAVRVHRKDADGVAFACSAKDFPLPADIPAADLTRGPIPRMEPDVLLELFADTEDGTEGAGREPWVVRAVVRPDVAAGTISCQDELMKMYPRRLTKVRVRKISSFDAASALHALEHLELRFQDQFVSRSDMLEATLAMENRALVVGQCVFVTGFTFTVSRMLRRTAAGDLQECVNGLVTKATHVSFESLTFATTCLFCVSSELDEEMCDGRLAFDWAIDSLMSEYATMLRTRYKASPLLRIMLFGATTNRDQYITTACVLRSSDELDGLAQELKRQVNLFRNRLVEAQEVDAGLSGFSMFQPAACSNLLDAINVALERFGKHGVNRILHITGHSLFVVTAGKGIFCVPRVREAELTARRIHDIGIEKCTIVCVGRPPLHASPLFECDGRDPDLQNQRALKVDPSRFYYSQPNWLRCLYYDVDAAPSGGRGGRCSAFLGPPFTLLERNDWYANAPRTATGKLGAVTMPRTVEGATEEYCLPCGPQLAKSCLGVSRSENFSRSRSTSSRASIARFHSHTNMPSGVGTFSPSSYTLRHTGNMMSSSRPKGIAGSMQPTLRRGGGEPRALTPPRHDGNEIFVACSWVDKKQQPAEGDEDGTLQELQALLDTDLAEGGMLLTMKILGEGYEWNPAITMDSKLREAFINSFESPPAFGASAASCVCESRGTIFAGPVEVVGDTLLLETRKCPNLILERDEDIRFNVQPEFVVQAAPNAGANAFSGSPRSAPRALSDYDLGAFVGTVSPQWATIFAFQPVNPYTGTAVRKQQGRQHNVLTTNESMENRWSYRFPTARVSGWDALCRCPLMPVKCPAETIVDNSLSFDKTNYTVEHSGKGVGTALNEMVYQRLTQGFQLVSLGPREAVLTMGHQTHTLRAEQPSATKELVTVDSSQHRGVWNAQRQFSGTRGCLSFYRWNYLTKNFEHCQGSVHPDVGLSGKALPWNGFDNNVLGRRKDADATMPSRHVTYVLLPAVGSQHASSGITSERLRDFLSRRFSTLLSVVAEDGAASFFDEASNEALGASPNDLSWVQLVVGEDSPDADWKAVLESGSSVPVHYFQLGQPANSEPFAALHRRRFAPKTGVQSPTLIHDRAMYVNVALGTTYHPRCAFALRASWTICTGSIVADWDSHLRLVAPDFGLNVVRVPRTGFDVLGQLDLLPVARFEWQFLPRAPAAIIGSLVNDGGYYPEQLPVHHSSRLFHVSGDAIVVVTRMSISWGENPLRPTGTKEHLSLYHDFLRTCSAHENASV